MMLTLANVYDVPELNIGYHFYMRSDEDMMEGKSVKKEAFVKKIIASLWGQDRKGNRELKGRMNDRFRDYWKAWWRLGHGIICKNGEFQIFFEFEIEMYTDGKVKIWQ